MTSSNNFSNFQSFDAVNYLNEADLSNLTDVIANFIINKAHGENKKFSYDEIIKVLNSFWWKREIKDVIIQKIWLGTNK
jgi:ABC-type sugar transport system permease subunit